MRISMTVVMDVPDGSGNKVKNRVTASALKAAARAGGCLLTVGSRESADGCWPALAAVERRPAPRFFTVGAEAEKGGPA